MTLNVPKDQINTLTNQVSQDGANSGVDTQAHASMVSPTPTHDTLKRRFADFATFQEALDYAAQGQRGINIYSSRGELKNSLSYRELRYQAQRIASKLLGQDLKPQSRIAMIAETSQEFMCNFIGAIYAGMLPVPLPLPTSFGYHDGYVRQIRQQLQSSKASLLIGPEGLLSYLSEAAQGLEDVILTTTWSGIDKLSWAPASLPQAKSDEVAYLQYSSGSTRSPYGVEITHKALLDNCRLQALHGMQLCDDDRAISWLPLYHDMGLVGFFITPLTSQVSLDIIPTDQFVRRPLSWLRHISQCDGNAISYAPNFGYNLITRRVKEQDIKSLDLSRWRIAGCGGDMIKPEVMQDFASKLSPTGFDSRALTPSYGLAEFTLAITIGSPNRDISTTAIEIDALGDIAMEKNITSTKTRSKHFVNCGPPLPGVRISIRDNNNKVLQDEQIGQIFVHGKSRMRGYYHNETETQRAITTDGWLNTGDAGFIKDGDLYVVGRIKDMIIINGCNYWPQDIEWAIEKEFSLNNGDVAAFSISGNTTEVDNMEKPVVLVHCKKKDPQEQIQLQENIREVISKETSLQCEVLLIPPRSLPLTSSGKLTRAKARQMFLSGEIKPISLQAVPVG